MSGPAVAVAGAAWLVACSLLPPSHSPGPREQLTGRDGDRGGRAPTRSRAEQCVRVGMKDGAGSVRVPAREGHPGGDDRRGLRHPGRWLRASRGLQSWREEGPCAPRARPTAAPLLTRRAGFPSPGSAEPVRLPSDSLRGAHADARDERGCGSRGERRGSLGGGGQAAAAGAPPSAASSAQGRGRGEDVALV